MTRTYVAIDDPVHRLLRNLTQRTPLKASLYEMALWQVQYEVNPQQVPDTYFSLALLHGLGGMDAGRAIGAQASFGLKHRIQILDQAGHFDITRLDRRCSRDIRLKHSRLGPIMLSSELLCHGSGALRARNDNLRNRVHRKLMEEHGRLKSTRQQTCAVIRALHGGDTAASGVNEGRDSYESTNVIYGDALGEIEQLWERRAEMMLLDAVAQSLCHFRSTAVICAGSHPPENLSGIVQLHLQRQALWRTPPRTGRALLKRIEFILTNTVVDSWPKTEYLAGRTNASGQSSSGSPFDGSGYDGWLSS